MKHSVDDLKKLSLVWFLSTFYNVSFTRGGAVWMGLSPFTAETKPSFCVRCEADGHWVFKDHSSGLSGTIFDFVCAKENLADFTSAWRWLDEHLNGQVALPVGGAEAAPASVGAAGYDVGSLYEQFRAEDVSLCGDYLRDRGIRPELVEELIGSGTVVANHYKGRLYCCFAVRDVSSRLHCLYKRQIDGDEKRVLGRRHVFSLDWERLAEACEVFLCEGIIDYLSLKSLHGDELVGMALLGNDVGSVLSLVNATCTIVAAVDQDAAGERALSALRERVGAERVRRYDLCGCKDPNELLVTRAREAKDNAVHGKRLSLEEKLAIAFSEGPSREVAERFGVHHSRVCELRNEAQDVTRSYWEDRRPGPQVDNGVDPEEFEKVKSERAALQRESDLLKMRRDWLEMKVRWHEEGLYKSGSDADSTGTVVPRKKKRVKAQRRRNRKQS